MNDILRAIPWLTRVWRSQQARVACQRVLLALAVLTLRVSASAQLLYFGYAGGSDTVALYRTAAYTNYTQIGSGYSGDLVATIQAINAKGKQAAVSLQTVLWDNTTIPAQLHYNWETTWSNWVAANSSVLTAASIVAFLPFDEPMLAGIDMHGYELVCAKVKQTFPWAKVALIEGASAVNTGPVDNYVQSGGSLPNVDWIGVDIYCIDPTTHTGFQATVNKFKSLFSGRKWIYVMDGFWDACHTAAFGSDINIMAAVANEWYSVASTDADAIAIGVFLWPAIPGSGWTTSVDFPQFVLDAHRRAGSHVNLVPNPSFELGGSASASGWALYGPGTMSIVSSPVTSGSRAVQVSVPAPDDIGLYTAPEPSSIWVAGGKTYNLSAKLLSAGGALAGTRVIEWGADGSVIADRFLNLGGGTGSWVTFSDNFTVNQNTSYLSIRLMHHVNAGTFTWDDVKLTRISP